VTTTRCLSERPQGDHYHALHQETTRVNTDADPGATVVRSLHPRDLRGRQPREAPGRRRIHQQRRSFRGERQRTAAVEREDLGEVRMGTGCVHAGAGVEEEAENLGGAASPMAASVGGKRVGSCPASRARAIGRKTLVKKK
jgi:hypothetical protein